MRQITIFFTILSFLVMPVAGLHAEETADAYADSLVNYTTQVLNPSNAIGAPDSAYADFMAEDHYIKLDLGEGEEGIGDLKIYLYLFSYGATVKVEFYDESDGLLDEWTEMIPIGTPELTADYTGTEPYRYVRINSIEDELWKIDAVEVMELYTAPVEEVIEEETVVEEVIVEPTDQGRLITLPDDGDASTQYDTAVYFVGSDDKRHAFPNDTIYFSWFENFDDVVEIGAEEMSDYSLGGNITIRPGTHLVKLQSSPKVYAVEPGAALRELMSEEVAGDLYGDEWADRVVDIADGFWGNYEIGDQIAAAVHPSGTVLVPNSTGEVLYLNNGVYYSLSGAVHDSMRFNDDFYTQVEDEIFSLYVDGGDLGLVTTVQYPY